MSADNLHVQFSAVDVLPIILRVIDTIQATKAKATGATTIVTGMATPAFTSHHVLALDRASPNKVPKFKYSEKCALLIKWLPMVRAIWP